MRISDWSSDVCSSVLLVLRTIAYGQYPFPFLLGERLGAGFACRTLTPVSEGFSTAPAAQRPVRDAQHTASLVRACASCHSVVNQHDRSEEHTSELQSLMRISYAVFCLKKQKQTT